MLGNLFGFEDYFVGEIVGDNAWKIPGKDIDANTGELSLANEQ